MFLTDEGGLEDEITSRHPDPELEATLLGIRRRRRDVDGASESRRVARTAEPILAHDVRRAADPDLDAEQRGSSRGWRPGPTWSSRWWRAGAASVP